MTYKKSRGMSNAVQLLLVLGFVFTGLVGFGGGIYYYYHNIESERPINQLDNSLKNPVVQDPTLLVKSQQLGIDVSRVNLNLSQSTEAGALADFQTPNIIDVNPGQDDKATFLSLGHEYYHYYWKNELTPDEKADLSNKLVDFYNGDTWLQNRMKPYNDAGCKDECFNDELHSVTCTEIPSWVITQKFIDYCNSVVPNRSLFIQ